MDDVGEGGAEAGPGGDVLDAVLLRGKEPRHDVFIVVEGDDPDIAGRRDEVEQGPAGGDEEEDSTVIRLVPNGASPLNAYFTSSRLHVFTSQAVPCRLAASASQIRLPQRRRQRNQPLPCHI